MQFENKETIHKLKQLPDNTPDTEEKIYYRKLFEEYYPNMSHVIPYFWMPKYVEATDASARTLSIYKNIPRKEEFEDVIDL
jgi:asparagine synthase (glutamine-hydrolysing)